MSNPEVDPNKLAAEVIIQATERVIATASDPVRTKLRRLIQSVSNAYAPFLEKTLVRVQSIRTFLRPTESVDLLDHYVPVRLTDKTADYDVDEVLDRLSRGQRLVVSGLAGRGKSVLMRYLALSLYHAPRGRIPLFLELRNLNPLSSKNLLQLIHSQYAGTSSVRFDDFIEALRRGYFILILDGFDEVSPADRPTVERQIVDISITFENCPMVVSGRPYERFPSWEKFAILHLKPMSLDQTRDLISRSAYDEDVKKTFLKRLTPEFYKKHESFLNTPLLAIMLMLTFEEYAEIPSSLHEFYRNAFDTLVRRHDAMKAQFLRETHSGCTAEEFKKIFSSFCLLSYSKSAFTFDRETITDFLASAIKQRRLRYRPAEVLNDFVESICLLQEEGFEFSFVHRSFQEYFCALFVSTAPAGLVKKYLDSGKFRATDDVLPMLYGMVPDRVESEWALGVVEDILTRFSQSDEDCNWKYAIELYPRIDMTVSRGRVGPIMLDEGELAQSIAILRRFYPAYFHVTDEQRIRRRSRKEQKEWQEGVQKSFLSLEESGEPQLRGFAEALRGSRRDETRHFSIALSADFRDAVCAMYADDLAGPDLSALRAIRKDQRQRAKGGDEFLKEVFSP